MKPHIRYEKLTLPTHVLCDWPYCSIVVRADDATWDDDTDSPYCSREHYEQAHDMADSKRQAFEDYYLGYVDEYDPSEYKPWIGGQR